MSAGGGWQPLSTVSTIPSTYFSPRKHCAVTPDNDYYSNMLSFLYVYEEDCVFMDNNILSIYIN